MVAIQGPKVMDLIGRFSSEVPRLKRYAFCEKNLLILRMLISRTGYTGEDGVEVILDAHLASKAMTLLTKGGAKETDSTSPSWSWGTRYAAPRSGDAPVRTRTQ